VPIETKMTINERRKYVAKMKERYVRVGKKERGRLLDEMVEVTGLHRKSLIRLLSMPDLSRRPRRKQRGRKYGPDVDDAIRIISESLDYVCAERLTPALAGMAVHLSKFGEIRLTPELQGKLERISVATVGRTLRRLRQDTNRLPRRRPRPANRVMRQIPIDRIPWDEDEVGHFEADTVHHCGEVPTGKYVHTIQMVDVATGWSERQAVLGRSEAEFEVGLRRIKERIPARVVEIHMDNGSEFVNDHFVRFWRRDGEEVKLSRSRPYRKNDNRFVEQKQWSLVRSYFGEVRLDTRKECEKMNEIYEKLWVYNNLFQPVMKLERKEVVSESAEGLKYKYKRDRARTPFERLCERGAIDEAKKEELEAIKESTNPRQLRREIYRLLDELWELVEEERRWTDMDGDEPTGGQTTKKGGRVLVTLSNE